MSPEAPARCKHCRSETAKVFRRGLCRTCYRKLGSKSPAAASDGRRLRGVPQQTDTKRNTRRIGPEARVEAMRLLAEGHAVRAVGRLLRVRPQTVMDWRDSPEGQQQLAEARRARAEALATATEDAHRVLREGATRAAQVLVDNLHAARANSRTKAAQEILDRIGLPRTERVEAVGGLALLDLTRLSDEELEALDRITTKARKDGTHG